MAGGLVQGTTRAPFGGDVKLGGGFRLTPLADGTFLLDFTGNGAGGAGGVHAESHRAGGLDPLSGAYTGITGLGTLLALDVSGDANVGGSLIVTADLSAGALTAGSVEVAGQLITSAVGVNFNSLLVPNPPLSSIPFGAGKCTNLDSDLLDGEDGSYYLNRSNHTGTQTSAAISDFDEAAQDAAALLWSGGGQVTYNDAAPSLAITAVAATLLTGIISPLRISGTYTGITGLGTLTTAIATNVATAGSTALTLQYGASVTGLRSNGAGGLTWLDASGGTDASLSHTPGSTTITCTNGWTFSGTLRHTGSLFGAYGVAAVARPSAITQTYATADKTHSARTAAALTDNVAGTVGTTVAAIPNPADAPVDADALREDLVTNVIPALRNALSSVIDQVNKGRADALDTSQLLNAVVDDLQSEGWLA